MLDKILPNSYFMPTCAGTEYCEFVNNVEHGILNSGKKKFIIPILKSSALICINKGLITYLLPVYVLQYIIEVDIVLYNTLEEEKFTIEFNSTWSSLMKFIWYLPCSDPLTV